MEVCGLEIRIRCNKAYPNIIFSALDKSRTFNDKDALWNFLTAEPVGIFTTGCHIAYTGTCIDDLDFNFDVLEDPVRLFFMLRTHFDMSSHSRAVKSLSAEALQILSTALRIHLGFWAWVISDQATDGHWQNTYSECEQWLLFRQY
jgi:hypothetical protein